MTDGNTCDVCGGTETKLVDGFYYCAECGTQDTNVRETIVERTALADGTLAFAAKKSIKIKDGVKMSEEWHKWHAYNFALAGLAERMLKLGAEPSFKMKVLWIWTKYIKKYQNKKEMGLTDAVSDVVDGKTNASDNEEKHVEEDEYVKAPSLTLKTLLCILYLALNLDRSTIQLSRFHRYVKDGRLHAHRCLEYIPKEIRNTRELRWINLETRIALTATSIPSAINKFEGLDLGPHLVPDLESITDNLLKELCLPKDLKNLVISLMDFAPINFLDKANKSQNLPDSESVVMSYILVALKMCFGLDDKYEIRLSDAVDEINYEENHLKAYKTDMFLEPSERLFSFREWYKYLMFRKHMLCKYYLPIAKECNLVLDDYIYMEHSKRKAEKEVKLSDEVTMDIINKIPGHNDFSVIPLSEFEPSATPISTYADVISRHLRDPDTRHLLVEDFTQYSIKYACQDLSLRCSAETSENIIVGVNETGKTMNELIGLQFLFSSYDSTMVYVKNCENKNWYKTKRPTAKHIVKEDSDHGYNSNIDNSPTLQDAENTCNSISEEDIRDKKLEVFEEEEEGKNIFDDDFLDTDTDDTKLDETVQNFGNSFSEAIDTLRYEDRYDENNELENSEDIQSVSLTGSEVDAKPTFDPSTFNREEAIKELIIAACNKYKVPVPSKFTPQKPSKRKAVSNEQKDATTPKRAKRDEETKRVIIEKKEQIKEIVSVYYRSLKEDVFHQISQEVRLLLENVNENARHFSYDENSFTGIDNDSVRESNNPDTVIENLDRNLETNLDQFRTEVNENNLDQNAVNGEKSDDESILDPVYKGEPNFDEKTHNTKQLYLKINGQLESRNLLEIENDDEYTLIEEIIKNSSESITATVDSDFDSSDDLPLSHLKKQKQQKNYDCLIKKTQKLNKFNYWFKHYISQYLRKTKCPAKGFEAGVRDSFSRSFAFVLSECAFILNCPTCTLYRHLTLIEEKMLKEDGFKKKKGSFKGTGVVLERRELADRLYKKKRRQHSS